MTALSPARLLILTIAISLATFMFVLDYSIANVAIPYIAGGMAVAFDQGTYVITAFAVGNAIGLPVTGWLSKRMGQVKLLCLSLLLFTFFSWTCGASFNFELLVISRFLQGLSSGPMIPLSQTLLIRAYPESGRARALAFWSIIVITAPIAGPILGGWISYDYSWPWIFYINIPFGLFSAFIIWCYFRQQESSIEKEPLDGVGLCLLAISVSCLQFLLDKGEQFDWMSSPVIRICACVSLIGFTLLVVWSLMTCKPLIQLTLFQIRTFAISVVYIGVIYAIYFGSVVLIPLWLQSSMGYTPIWAGVAVAPIGIGSFIMGPFMGRAMKAYGISPLLFLCLVIFALSCFYTAYFDTHIDIAHVAISRGFLGSALAFFITPLFALSITGIAESNLASATGLFHFIRALSGGIGTSLFTTLWTRRSAFHHARLTESVTACSFETKTYLHQLAQTTQHAPSAFEQINQTVTSQSEMLGLNDCFFVMGWIFLSLMLLLPLTRSQKVRP